MKKVYLLGVLMLLTCCACSGPESPKVPEASLFLKGGDISMLTVVEQNGGKFSDESGEDDCLKILSRHGFNMVRLRLYNDPGNPAFEPSCRMYPGIQDEADILRLARRVKAEGMQIELTFHYSDYWTNGAEQHIPHAWEGLSGDQLVEAVYDFTAGFLQKMAAQGTVPEFVSLGNESQAGILYPVGSVADIPTLCKLYNAGARAVREKAPGARIIIHSDDAGDGRRTYDWYYGALEDGGVDFDIIGSSYYPYWTGKNAAEVVEWAKHITALCDKDLMIMELGYSWNPARADGWPGQLEHNHPYPDEAMTPEGQAAFIDELFGLIKDNPTCRIIGALYWDPVFIHLPKEGIGWIPGEANVVENSTLFDFSGRALPALDVFGKY